jgi:FAD synthase
MTELSLFPASARFDLPPTPQVTKPRTDINLMRQQSLDTVVVGEDFVTGEQRHLIFQKMQNKFQANYPHKKVLEKVAVV